MKLESLKANVTEDVQPAVWAQGETPLVQRLRLIPVRLSGSDVPAQSELVDRSRKFKFPSEVALATKSHPRIISVPRESEPARIALHSWSD